VPVPVARGRRGAVVAPHHLASAAGLHALRIGGSAVDAAIATNAVLAVVMPQACGLGGDAFWLIWDEGSKRQTALNGSGRAPAGVDPVALRRAGMERLPLRGPLSVTVPGAVRSWADAHAAYGRLSVEEILGPAIDLARDGFPVDDGLAAAVERTSAILAHELEDGGRAWAAEFRGHGRAWRPFEVLRRTAVGRTLERLAEAGFGDFYEGRLAENIARCLAEAGSPMAPADLEQHTCEWAEPISTVYRDVTATTHPPNSQGIVALELLNILETFDAPPPAAFGPEGVRDPAWVHIGIEAAKLAFADRDRYLTDPGFRAVPVDELLDKARAGGLARMIDPARAAMPPVATAPRGGGTVYLATVDGAGNAVSLIESNYMGFGSGVVDPETGIHFQNRGSYFSLEPDHPNFLEGGKRTLHTLMPGMLFRDGRPWMVLGSMGGDAQPQIHAQVVSALVDGVVDVGTAISAPRWFVEPPAHFAPPVEVRAEPRFAPGVLDALEALGHPVDRVEAFDSGLGHCHAIELVNGGPTAEGGSLAAATDPRSNGLPSTW
jgi:gamma-glutamyltranspeptidase/glutathione hydrolase